MEYLITVICEYIGHGKTINNVKLDEVLKKSIELECPLKMAPLIRLHKRFLYFPKEEIITNMIKFYYEKNDYTSFKELVLNCFYNT